MEAKIVDKKYFLTVEWCNSGNRGIFCSKDGIPFSQDHLFTDNEIWEILDAFGLILNPISLELTREELKAYNRFHPLAEYSNQFGIAIKGIREG